MASYTIPEEVTGLPLFVPDGFDYFEITPSALPNGDPALRVRGDLSINYKALCPLPVTSPNIYANLTSWAFSCWIKVPAGNGGNNAFRFSRVLWAAMTGANTSNGPNPDCFMGMTALDGGSNTNINFIRGATSSGASQFTAESAQRDNTWKLICVNVPNTVQTGTMHINDQRSVATSDVQTGGGAFSSGAYLCIGSYTGVGALSFAADWSIAKMAFHDHHLNATERSLLYNAMVS